jgi:hypothetical protein
MANQHRQWGACYQYRLMSPLGVYLPIDIDVDGATLYSHDNLVAVVVDGDIEYIELLLTAAILLSSPAISDNLRFYPFPYVHQLELESSQVVSFDTLAQDIRQKHSSAYTPAGATVPEFDWYENAKGASLPPVLGGAAYNWSNVEIDVSVVRELFNRLKQNACRRIRGALSSLVKSNQLSCHLQFQQQAAAELIDCIRLMQETEHFHVGSAQLGSILSQLGDSAEDYLISRHQMAERLGPKDFHRLFVQTCTQLRKFLMSL